MQETAWIASTVGGNANVGDVTCTAPEYVHCVSRTVWNPSLQPPSQPETAATETASTAASTNLPDRVFMTFAPDQSNRRAGPRARDRRRKRLARCRRADARASIRRWHRLEADLLREDLSGAQHDVAAG